MGRITADQSQQLMAVLTTNVNWDSIDFEKLKLQDRAIRNGREAGRQFEIFLKNGCRIQVGNSKTVATVPFNPAEFIGQGWNVWKGPVDGNGLSGEEDIDERSMAISVIDPAQILLEIYLKEGEGRIVGEEKLLRMKNDPNKIRLGGNVFLGLWKDYKTNDENSAIEQLYQERGITYLDFFGLILRGPIGDRFVLCLSRSDGGEWDWDYGWLDDDWSADSPSACLASTQA